jgi:endo-alpha-N-acetylgalactosaminidase
MPTILHNLDTYVSDMTFTSTTGPVVRDRSDVPDAFGDGQTMPLNVAGNLFVKGLGVQANSVVEVALSGGYTNFLVTISVDGFAPAGASVTFQVVADGTVLYTSPTKTAASGGTHLNINVAGYQHLFLKVNGTGGGTANDYADWGNALLTPAQVTDVTTRPLSAHWNWGPIMLEYNALGGPLVINGETYLQGIGTTAASSGIRVNLSGHYSSFTATIGVDSVIGSLSSVIFQVSGDGRSLYRSPVLTATSAPIPISIRVAGVQTLTLAVIAGSSISPSLDYADWGLAGLHS